MSKRRLRKLMIWIRRSVFLVSRTYEWSFLLSVSIEIYISILQMWNKNISSFSLIVAWFWSCNCKHLSSFSNVLLYFGACKREHGARSVYMFNIGTFMNNLQILDTNPQLFFHLQQQRFIELIRQNEIQKALDFAKEELVPRGEENVCSFLLKL